MIVDFQTIDIYDRQPTLVLKAPSGKVIQTLGYAHNIECSFNYSETSKLTFDLPAYVNGEPTPNYDKVVGEMIIDLVGWGLFILQNPSITNTGIQETKSCTAYSLEYELTHRQMSLEEGTYNFWDSGVTAGDSPTTLMGIILQYCPGWSMGDVDDALIGKYRTFDQIQDNAYNVMMNTLQVPYNCIFSFDTYKRKINVIDANSDAPSNPIFISLDNLAKEIEINEQSENLITVLDVYGADDVDIRGANPLGTNKIYNLDYFMNDVHFDQETIDKWNAWKDTFEQNRQTYYDLSIRRAMKTSEKIALQARKTDEEGVLSTYETEQGVNIRQLSYGDETGAVQERLDELKDLIPQQRATITGTQLEIDEVQSELDDILAQLKEINEATAFESFFTDDEIEQLQHYFIENALEESSFAVNEYTSFSDESQTVADVPITSTVTGSQVTTVDPREGTNEEIYSFIGGTVEVSYGSYTDENDEEHPKFTIVASIKRGSAELNDTTEDDVTTRRLTETIVVGAGTKTDNEENNVSQFMNGTLIILGKHESTESDVADTEINVMREGSTLTCSVSEGDMYLTSQATLFEQYDVELDLYEFAQEELRKMAYPTYTFKIDTSNFLALEDFKQFASQLSLGQRLYIDIGTKVLEPILVGVEMSFEDLTDFSLSFSDTYHGDDNAFGLVDLLQKSVSMGHKLDLSKYSYGAYVNSGANTAVKDFMTSALDASKNAVVNAANQAVKIDESGIRLRNPDESGGFDDEQMWIINNNIVLTDDGWNTAKVAIGHFHDENTGDGWGVVAPNIVGTLLAGENLVIESKKAGVPGSSGETSLFRVDGDGASLYNAKFELITPLGETSDGVGHYGNIVLDPELGIGIGSYSGAYTKQNVTRRGHSGQVDGIIFTSDDGSIREWNSDIMSGGLNSYDGNTNFWVDLDGSIHFKGTLEGADGQFTGSLKVGDPDGSLTGETHGLYVDENGNLSLGGIYKPGSQIDGSDEETLEAPFYVDAQGNMYATSGTFTGVVSADNLLFKDPTTGNFESVLDDHNRIMSNFLDLGGIQLEGETGNITMSGTLNLGGLSSIIWGNNIPGSTYEYSDDGITWTPENKDQVTLVVSTVNNPGIKQGDVKIFYDTEFLEFGSIANGSVSSVTAENDKTTGCVTCKFGNGTSTVSGNGTLCTLTFNVNGRVRGDYKFTSGGKYTSDSERDVPVVNIPFTLGTSYGESSAVTGSPFKYQATTTQGINNKKYCRTVTKYTKRDQAGNLTEIIKYGEPTLTTTGSYLPSYIKETHIDMGAVTSPSFLGNDMYAINFKIVDGFTQGSEGTAVPQSILGTMGQINGWAGEYKSDGSKLYTVGVGLRQDDDHYVICTSLGTRLQTGTVNNNSGTGWSSVVTMSSSAYMASGNRLYLGLENNNGRLIGGYFNVNSSGTRTPKSIVEMTSSEAKMQYSTTTAGVYSTVSLTENDAIVSYTDDAFLDVGLSGVTIQYTANSKIEIGGHINIETKGYETNISISANNNAGLKANSGTASLIGATYTEIMATHSAGANVQIKDYVGNVRWTSNNSEARMQYSSTSVACSSTGISIDSGKALTMTGTSIGITASAGTTINTSGSYSTVIQSGGSTRLSAGSQGIWLHGQTPTSNYEHPYIKVTTTEAYMQYRTNRYLNVGNSGVEMRFDNTGFVSVNSTNARLSYDTLVYVNCYGSGVDIRAGNYQMWIYTDGSYGPSDIRWKKNIEYSVDGDLVDELKPVRFMYNWGTDYTYGFIAQDVRDVIPELVGVKHGEGDPEDGYLGLNYDAFVPILTAKLQKHTRIIKEQEDRIAELERQIREVRNDG